MTSNMMMNPVLDALAESGYGVTIRGFHCPVMEFGKRQGDLLALIKYPADIALFEENGYVTFLAMSQERTSSYIGRRVSTFRREPHKFFQELPKFLASTKAICIERMILTGSLGSISLTLLFRSVDIPSD